MSGPKSLQYDEFLCRLCLGSKSTQTYTDLAHIEPEYRLLLDDFSDGGISQVTGDEGTPHSICMDCVNHIHWSWVLRNRLRFTETLWKGYQDKAEDTSTGHSPTPNVILNCHMCEEESGMNLYIQDLLQHIGNSHGEAHLLECHLCQSLKITQSPTALPVSPQVETVTEDAVEMDLQKEEEAPSYTETYMVYTEEAEEEDPTVEFIQPRNVHHTINTETPQRKRYSHSCAHCGFSFSTESKLKSHLLTHEVEETTDTFDDLVEMSEDEVEVEVAEPLQPNITLDCSTCGESFTDIEEFSSHLKTHSELTELKSKEPRKPKATTTFQCGTCGQQCRDTEALTRHVTAHSKAFHTCAYCNTVFKSRQLQEEHSFKAHKWYHQCPVCDEAFPRIEDMNNHANAVHEKMECFHCAVLMPTLKGLKLHRQSHKTEYKRAVAELAGGQEKAAVVEEAAPVVKKPFCCTLCDESFRFQKRLDFHMKDKHNQGGYECNVCHRTYDSLTKLKGHSYKHKMKLCGICGASVATSLTVHMLRHAADKPFKCTVDGCDKQFPRNSDLKEHQKIHTGEKPFGCEICGMRFSRKNKVSVHMRTHTGEKPYKCTFEGCERQFAQSFDRTLHMRRHTGEKPFECEKCGKRFILTTLLKAHTSSCTGEAKD